jgi:two-component system sensor histidine kinase KdpD
MEQVLVNLLDNATKYSPSGAPIEVRAAETDGRLVVEVADRGPGLPPEDLNRVFEKFYRATGTARKPGAGLGLAICRGIIELHGGDMVAENRPGGGTLFRFRLPLATAEAGVPPIEVPLDS